MVGPWRIYHRAMRTYYYALQIFILCSTFVEIVSFLPKLYFSPSHNDTFQGNLRGRPLQTLTQSFEQIFLALK